MTTQIKRTLQPMTINYDNERHSNTQSELQSLLVSSVRYDPSTSIADHGEYRHMSKVSHGSLIKKNIPANIFVEDSVQCSCQHKVEQMSSSIKLLTLSIQQLEAKINICFTQQASLQTQITKNTVKLEHREHQQWQIGQSVKEQIQQYAHLTENSKSQLKQMAEQILRMKKSLCRIENKDGERCLSSKLVQHKLQKYRGEQDARLATLFDAIQQIGSLQKKMINEVQKDTSTYPDEQSILPFSVAPSRQLKILKGSIGRKATCESTNISYSRNNDSK